MIRYVEFDWYYTTECGEAYVKAEIGSTFTMRNGNKAIIVSIEEHLPKVNGDLYAVIIKLDSGDVVKVFNPNYIEYE